MISTIQNQYPVQLQLHAPSQLHSSLWPTHCKPLPCLSSPRVERPQPCVKALANATPLKTSVEKLHTMKSSTIVNSWSQTLLGSQCSPEIFLYFHGWLSLSHSSPCLIQTFSPLDYEHITSYIILKTVSLEKKLEIADSNLLPSRHTHFSYPPITKAGSETHHCFLPSCRDLSADYPSNIFNISHLIWNEFSIDPAYLPPPLHSFSTTPSTFAEPSLPPNHSSIYFNQLSAHATLLKWLIYY